MKVNWRLILGSPKVDTEAKKELGASSYLEGDSRKYKGVSRENQMGKKAKPIKGCVNEQLLLWAAGAQSWDPVRNHVEHTPELSPGGQKG